MSQFTQRVEEILVEAIHGKAMLHMGEKAFEAGAKTPSIVEAKSQILSAIRESMPEKKGVKNADGSGWEDMSYNQALTEVERQLLEDKS